MRTLLQLAAVALSAAIGAFAPALAPSALAAPTAEDFVNSQIAGVSLSPSGQHVAVIFRTGPKTNSVRIGTYASGKLNFDTGLSLGERPAVGVWFKNDNRLVIALVIEDVAIAGTRDEKGGRVTFNRVNYVAVNRDGSGLKVLMEQDQLGADIVSLLRNDPDHIMLQSQDPATRATDLYKVNVTDGSAVKVEAGQRRAAGGATNKRAILTRDWMVDANGNAFARTDIDFARNTVEIYTRPVGGSGWKLFTRFAQVGNVTPVDLQGLASPQTAYVVSRANGDKRALWEYDLASGQPVKGVVSSAQGEVYAAQFDPITGQLIGTTAVIQGLPVTTYTDQTLAAVQQAVGAAIGGFTVNQIVSRADDDSVMIIRSEASNQPPTWTLFDLTARAAVRVGSALKIDPRLFGVTQTVVYPSSDGRQITGFITMPPGKSRNAPLIVMPHGGPESQDTTDFDMWRQFLVTRGYAVFQPQFRGGDGYGLAHEQAGHLAWGTLVQDDVRTGIAYLAAQGMIDTNRMCVFGWSYGGYMAMAGPTMSPDLYKCAVAGAGVADLPAMLDWVREEQGGGDSLSYLYWSKRMGDEAQARAASPTSFAGQLNVPFLLIHGEDDDVVPIEQSELMEAALTAAGKPVEFMRIPKTGHSPRGENMIAMLKRLESFLMTHLPPG